MMCADRSQLPENRPETVIIFSLISSPFDAYDRKAIDGGSLLEDYLSLAVMNCASFDIAHFVGHGCRRYPELVGFMNW